MAKHKNEFTQAIEEVMDEMRALRKAADKSNAVPFGMERLSRSKSVADRLRNGTKQERSEYLAKNGAEAMLKLLRGK